MGNMLDGAPQLRRHFLCDLMCLLWFKITTKKAAMLLMQSGNAREVRGCFT
jgi:hypothetical protein